MKAAAKRKISHAAKKESKQAVRTKKAKNPIFHHALLKTARMQEMIEWYAAVVGIETVFQAPGIAFLSNDGANHRISMVGNPQFLTNPNFRKSVGMHHLAFEYESVDDLLDCWHRLHEEYGYKPHVAVHHGMTLSFYYADPENNSVELQADVFGDWKKSKAWMRASPQFRADAIGKFVDPAAMFAARSAGVKTKELLRRAYAGEYPPAAHMIILLTCPLHKACNRLNTYARSTRARSGGPLASLSSFARFGRNNADAPHGVGLLRSGRERSRRPNGTQQYYEFPPL